MPLGRICAHKGGEICISCGRTCSLDNIRRAAKSKKHGLTKTRWQKLRLLALERDRYVCKLGRRGCTGVATTVHLSPRLAGDHDAATLGDLASCCAHCHGVVDGPRAR